MGDKSKVSGQYSVQGIGYDGVTNTKLYCLLKKYRKHTEICTDYHFKRHWHDPSESEGESLKRSKKVLQKGDIQSRSYLHLMLKDLWR